MVRLASHGWLVKFTVFDESVFLALDYGLPDWGGGECACDAGNIVFHALPSTYWNGRQVCGRIKKFVRLQVSFEKLAWHR